MRSGAENRKKTIIAGTLGALALLAFGWQVWGLMGGSPPTPPPSIAPVNAPPETSGSLVPNRPPVDSLPTGPSASHTTSTGPAMAGVNATKLSSTTGSLDPSLDEAAMLRTESLEYSGAGRNIFSATYTPAVVIPTGVPTARPTKLVALAPASPPPPPPSCPPSCPPIPLKFFGTEKYPNGKMMGFFISGDDVYMAGEGEIVSRKYKILSIGVSMARVEDLTTTYAQTIVLQN